MHVAKTNTKLINVFVLFAKVWFSHDAAHIFISLYLKAYVQNLVKKGQVVSAKNNY